jgi:hypothetical protein
VHINEWLSTVAEEEKEKQAASDLEKLFDRMSIDEVLKIAQEGSDSTTKQNSGKGGISPALQNARAQSFFINSGIKQELLGNLFREVNHVI